ncbi:hypothetical protein ACFYUY_17220 [Kitasatospora sp. NPDC004745]|uniref:hypothetical protein n=1 Tax=unclassified Kitasatospora TaxID=2633591 RepID=UPI0033FBC357
MAAADASSVVHDVVTSALPAVVAALLGAAGLWLRDWRARRSAATRRRQQLDEAQAYLGFLGQWFSTYAAVAPGADAAQARAWAAGYLEDQLRALQTPEAEAPRGEPTPFRTRTRLVLLLYPLHSFAGSMVRLLYYAALGLTVEFTSASLVTSDEWLVRVALAAFFLVAGLVVLGVLWRLAVQLSPGNAVPGSRHEDRARRAGPAPDGSGADHDRAPPPPPSAPPPGPPR